MSEPWPAASPISDILVSSKRLRRLVHSKKVSVSHPYCSPVATTMIE